MAYRASKLTVVKAWDLEDITHSRYRVQVIKKGSEPFVAFSLFNFNIIKQAYTPSKKNVFLNLKAWANLERVVPEIKRCLMGI